MAVNISIVFSASGASATVNQINEVGEATRKVGSTEVLKGISNIAFGFNNIVQAVQNLQGQLAPVYDALIGSNEKLNQQLLQSAATIASANSIKIGDTEIADPTEKIKALEKPLKASIKQLEKDTQSLVGVTSEQVAGVFNAILSNAGELNNQSKTLPDSIASATSLAKGLVATMGTMQVPLDQINQEARSIFTQQITSDSTIAKSLGITNEMVGQWKAQGILVDQLNEKFKTFVAGNALASRSVAGMSSNIQDIVEITGREAGAPLLDMVVDQLEKVYKFLDANQAAIQQGAKDAVGFIQELFGIIGDALMQIGEALMPVVEELSGSLESGVGGGASVAKDSIQLLADVVVNLVQASVPLLTIVAQLASSFSQFAGTEVGQTIIKMGLLTFGVGKMIAALQFLVPVVLAAQGAILTFATRTAVMAGYISTGGIPAIAALAARFVAFSTTLYTSAIPAITAFGTATAVALGPLIALGGAVTLAIIVKQTGDLRKTNEEIEGFQQQADVAADASLRLASKIKALNEIEKKGGLSPEQAKKREQLIKLAKEEAASNETLIASIKSIKPANDEQAGSLKALESQLTSVNKAIAKQAEGNKSQNLKIQSKNLEVLGDAYTQLKNKVNEAKTQLANDGGGKTDAAKQAANSLIELTQKQLDLDKISAAEAIKNLQLVANNRKLSYEEQLKAKDAISKIEEQQQQKETKSRLDIVKTAETQIQAAIAAGTLDQIEGEKKLTQVKQQEQQIRLQDIQASLKRERAAGRGDGAKAKELIQQEKQTQAEIAKARAEASDRLFKLQQEQQTKARTDAIKTSEAQIQSEIANGQLTQIEGEKKLTQIRQQELEGRLKDTQAYLARERQLGRGDSDKAKELIQQEKQIQAEIGKTRAEAADKILKLEEDKLQASLKRAEEAIAASEQQRQIEIQQMLNQGSITQAQAEEKKLDSAKKRLQEELALERQKVAQLEALPKYNNPQQEEQRQAQIRQSRQQTASLTLSLLQNEAQQEEEHRKKIIAAIQQEGEKRKQKTELAVDNIKQEIAANERLSQSLDRQKQLLDAQGNLSKARSDAATASGQIEIDKVNRAIEIRKQLASDEIKDADLRKALEEELATTGITKEAKVADVIKKRQELESSLAQEKIAVLNREQEQARLALEIDIQRNQLQAERLVLQSQSAQLQAEQNELEAQQKAKEAEQIKDPEERNRQVELANQGVELARRQKDLAAEDVANAREGLALQDQLAEKQRELLKIQQQTAQEQSQNEERKRLQAQKIETARTKAEQAQEGKGTGGGASPSGGAGGGAAAGGVGLVVGSKEWYALQKAQQFVSAGAKSGQFDGSGPIVAGVLSDLERAFASQLLGREVVGANPKMGNKELIGAIGGLRNDFKGLAGVMANRNSSVTNNFLPGGSRNNLDAGRTAIKAAGL